MIQERATGHCWNGSVEALGDSVGLVGVRNCELVVDPFGSEKLLEVFRDILTAVVASETFDFPIETVFHIGDIPLNGLGGVRLLFEKVNSGEPGKIIDERYVIIESSE